MVVSSLLRFPFVVQWCTMLTRMVVNRDVGFVPLVIIVYSAIMPFVKITVDDDYRLCHCFSNGACQDSIICFGNEVWHDSIICYNNGAWHDDVCCHLVGHRTWLCYVQGRPLYDMLWCYEYVVACHRISNVHYDMLCYMMINAKAWGKSHKYVINVI